MDVVETLIGTLQSSKQELQKLQARRDEEDIRRTQLCLDPLSQHVREALRREKERPQEAQADRDQRRREMHALCLHLIHYYPDDDRLRARVLAYDRGPNDLHEYDGDYMGVLLRGIQRSTDDSIRRMKELIREHYTRRQLVFQSATNGAMRRRMMKPLQRIRASVTSEVQWYNFLLAQRRLITPNAQQEAEPLPEDMVAVQERLFGDAVGDEDDDWVRIFFRINRTQEQRKIVAEECISWLAAHAVMYHSTAHEVSRYNTDDVVPFRLRRRLETLRIAVIKAVKVLMKEVDVFTA